MAEFKSGFVSIIGRPNVGKSTLLNHLVGEKIAIISDKPQTTRNNVLGIWNGDGVQVVFTDTPGIHAPKTKLGEYMVKSAREAQQDVDAILLLVEPIDNIGRTEEQILSKLDKRDVPVILVINKIDTVRRDKLLPVITRYAERFSFAAVVPISAKNDDGVEAVRQELVKHLSPGPQYFPDDMVTDQPERQVCAEILREKLLLCLDKEIPHGTAVEVTRFSEREDSGIIDLEATIYCEKDSHKGIIIGKGGAMLKKVSSLARQDIERFMGTKVYLQTWVKMKENWRDNVNLIQNFGYRCDD